MALTEDRLIVYQEGLDVGYPMAAVEIFAGSLVCVNAAGYAAPAADTVNFKFVGVALEWKDNSAGAAGAKTIKVRRDGIFQFAATSIAQASVGADMYVVDDQTFDESNPGQGIKCGKLVKVDSATLGWIAIGRALATAFAGSADALTVSDALNIYTGLTVATQLQEVMRGVKTAQYLIQPAGPITLETGAPTVVFANGAGDGFTQLTNKEVALRWNNHATPTKMAARFIIPPDLDPAADIVVHFLGAIVKAGGAEADSPTITCEAYFAALGAAMLADANCGGVSGEFLTAQTDKYQEKTLSIALADIPAVASVLTLIFNPTDGELPADDFVLAGVWLEVTRQCLTA